jgi:hypothetical protein
MKTTLICALLLLLAGCASPGPQAVAGTADNGNTPPVTLERSCRSDNDCTVKNVGNCCGAAPACVNVDSPTDPAAVMAQCQASGRMSVCGFRPISACQCVSGKCAAKSTPIDTLHGSPKSPEPLR